MITALCAIVDLIAFLASVSCRLSTKLECHLPIFTQPGGIHLVFNLPLAKLYTNSLMSSLNSRAGWKYGNSVGRALNGGGDSEGQRSVLNESNLGGRPVFGSQLRVSPMHFHTPSLRTPSDSSLPSSRPTLARLRRKSALSGRSWQSM